MPASCSVQRPSRSISRRCLEFILKWNWHLGQTKRFASRSLRKTMVRQDSHLTHRPSVRTRRSSGGVDCSIDFLSRLNQAMRKLTVESLKLKEETAHVVCALPSRDAACCAPTIEAARRVLNSRSPAEPVYPWCRGVSP